MLGLLILKLFRLNSQLVNLSKNVFLFSLQHINTVFDHSFITNQLVNPFVNLNHLLLIGGGADATHADEFGI